jgi:hypothetical protein
VSPYRSRPEEVPQSDHYIERAEAIAAVIADIKDGAKVVDLCKKGDELIAKCV